VTFVLFAALLWKFFYYRTRGSLLSSDITVFPCSFLPTAEEKALIKFFGDDYVKYRSDVGTKIPFIP
jgi:protein-S-isoprenylcysteine O-methyltransferase